MKKIQIGTSTIEASQIALGCMRMAGLSLNDASSVVNSARESEINFFDHADIYGSGESEITFGKVIKSNNISRTDIFIQSKCGIREGFYDFSKEHIMSSVEGSLSRLGTDYLDVLALHRPDALMEPDEVAEAFYQLHKQGKIRNFGVSNFSPTSLQLLQQALT